MAKKAPAKKAPAKKAAKKAAAKKAPARMVAKVSPLRGMAVEDWVKAKTSGWQREAVTMLIDVARHAVPEAVASIKWSQPVFDLNGPVAFIMPAKAHVTFGFWRGAELADPTGILQGGDRMKHIKVKSVAEIPHERVTAFMREAAQLNREKGSPSSRTQKNSET